ncbi:hypothetical protein CC80DRAFT_488915 [Byssothecium circinans]|uniref:Uncharacterized protein n=1 Tax=Byssothecium circinans TaxID=147558 RepID=A0A6A5U9W8_9PLEO|nr:hypothetical protein CC80DRAFT_488915 [Byssothecium circinans]
MVALETSTSSSPSAHKADLSYSPTHESHKHPPYIRSYLPHPASPEQHRRLSPPPQNSTQVVVPTVSQ